MIYKKETQNSFPHLNEFGNKRNQDHMDTDLSYNKNNYYTVYINKPDLFPLSKQQDTNKISTSKYTWYNVIPLILFEQFSKYINLYFLAIAMFQLIKQISISHGQPVILLPLIVVVIFNGLKDLIEDLKRKNSDKDENHRKCLVLKKSGFEQIKWEDVKIGNIVKVLQNEYFPADLLCINTKKNDKKENKEIDGICYVETKNLDGETNLKYKHSVKHINKLCKTEKEMIDLQGIIECSQPSEFINDFNGFYTKESNDDKIPIDRQSLLLRGTSLQETFCVYGIVVYTGFSTKIKKNQFKSVKKKSSNIEKIMNLQIILIFIFDIFLSLAAAILALIFYSLNDKVFFIKTYFVQDNYVEVFFITFGTSILIFTNLVPISLLVTMEIVKYIQGIFISWDYDLYDKSAFAGPLVQTSTLNEELGQVNFIFTDKTGTLTKNYMAFTRMNIGDKLYGNDKLALDKLDLNDNYGKISNFQFDDDDFYEHSNNPEHDNYNNIQMFLSCLSICHTVYTQFDNGKLVFNSSSPDEMALINAARKFGYIFRERRVNNEVIIEINGDQKIYTILDIIEYTLERKLMSVIVKCPDRKIRLFCKGADMEIRRRITQNPEQISTTNRALIKFAGLGLRTLMIAYKEITEEEYEEWNKEYIVLLQNSYSRINDIFERIEKNLYLLGSTAIEDTLQDEVGNCLYTFISAGIKVWVLTGDKQDTAKSIAFSCSLLTHEFIIFELENPEKKEEILLNLGEIERKMALEEGKKFGLIVSSEVISVITSEDYLISRFYQVSSRCNSVICCRISPKQKAQMVEIVRREDKSLITLAIGDGANDVNMIKSAHVGVGIIGVEGNQASRAADYSISHFSELRRLLLVHGRESYRKNSFVVCYNFYKNVLLVMPQFWFGFYCYFSGQTLYDPWIYQLFNIFFTSLPIVWFGIYDKEVSFNDLERDYNYYLQGIEGKLFNKRRFWYWIYYASFQGIIVFFFTLYQNNSFDSKGRTQDLWSIGSIIYTQVVLIANFQLFFSTSSHTYISISLLLLTFTLYFLTFLTNSSMSFMDITNSIVIIFHSATFYLSSFLTVSLCLVMYYGIKAYLFNFEKKKKLFNEEDKGILLPRLEPIQEYLINSNNLFYGSAFANEPGQTPYIAKKLL